jgi:fructose-specific phosphotransferase system IIC component
LSILQQLFLSVNSGFFGGFLAGFFGGFFGAFWLSAVVGDIYECEDGIRLRHPFLFTRA